MNKIKTGDEVIVLTGKCKKMRGTVRRVFPKTKKVLVDGINMVKKHVKPNPNAQQPGGIQEKEMPMQLSNVAIYNPVTEKADRVGVKFLDSGKKVRYFKSNGELIDID